MIDSLERPIGFRRDTLLLRLEAARARFIGLIAPAGYGKSTLARQFIENIPSAVCDCSAATDTLELTRAIIAALAELQPDHLSFLVQCEVQTSLALGSDTAITLAMQAWRQSTSPQVFVFENAESLLVTDGAVRFVSKLLTGVPPSRTILVCSRRPLPIRLTRFFPPHEILTLTADDLRLTKEEFRAVLCDPAIPEETVERTFDVSRGWPIVAALFARLWREARLDSVLRRLDDITLDELHEYIAQEALGALPKALLEALVAVALIPAATSEDIMHISNAKTCLALQEYARASPFLRVTGNVFELHPLVGTVLERRYGKRRESLLKSVAQKYEANGDHLRAAELYLAAHDQDSAAQSIDALSWLDTPGPSMQIARLVGSLDRAVLLQYPQLWGIAIAFSRFSIDPVTAIGEARIVLQRIGENGATSGHMHVVRPLAGYLSRLGMHDEGYRLICNFERTLGIPNIPRSINEAAVLYIRMMIAGRLGRTQEALSLADRVRPYAQRHPGMGSLFLLELAAETLRVLGRRSEERRMLDEAIQTARDGNASVNEALALAEASFGAWLAGDDGISEKYLEQLDRCVEENGVRGLWYYTAVARGNRDLPSLGLELPKWIACAHIVAACSCEDVNDAVRHAGAAHEAANKYGSPFLRVLALLLYAEVVPQLRSERLAGALRIAQQIESPALQNALEAHLAGDDDTGMLQAFIARTRRDVHTRARTCNFALFSGEVAVEGTPIDIPGQKLELLASLAQFRRGVSRSTLMERLWPGHEEASAVNAFNICLHQLRKLIGERSVVLLHGRYMLGDNVRVDVWQIEDFLAAMGLHGKLTEGQQAILRRFYDHLCEPLPDHYAACSWFDATERRIAELRCEIGERLAREALRSGDPAEALRLARRIMEYDPCDEPAREIAIRAYVCSGDEASAFREYRRYRQIVWEQLEAEPSLSMEAILSEAH